MNEKLKSRKFIVWITTTVLLILGFIISIFIKNMDLSNVVETLAEGYIWVSALYLGANAAGKFANKTGETNESIIIR